MVSVTRLVFRASCIDPMSCSTTTKPIASWSQILTEAVTGPKTGTALKTFPLIETTWKDWKEQYPETLVLSLKTGYLRPYHEDPYGIRAVRALGVIVGGSTKAYSFEQLKKVKTFPVRDRVGEQRVLVHFRKGIEKAWATDVEGKPVEFFLTYLRAWENFYPDSEIFEAP
jgi:hypothetical protein